jgi:nucleotide-binding universal stress UspA family protein
MNIGHILVPVDFSDFDRSALAYATMLARHHGAGLLILHVNEPPSAYFGQMYYGTAAPDKERRKEMLHALAPGDPKLPVEFEMRDASDTDFTIKADIARAIIECAEDHGVDLIVMSSHGRNGLCHALLGGITEAVLKQAPCPVLTVTERSRLPARDDAE